MPGARTGPRAVVFFPPSAQKSKNELDWTKSSPAGRELRVLMFPSFWKPGEVWPPRLWLLHRRTVQNKTFLLLPMSPFSRRALQRQKGNHIRVMMRTYSEESHLTRKSQQRQSLSLLEEGKHRNESTSNPTRTRLTCNWSEPLHNICCELKPITLHSSGNTIARLSLSLLNTRRKLDVAPSGLEWGPSGSQRQA